MKQDVLGAKHFHEALATTPKDLRQQMEWSFHIADEIEDALKAKGISSSLNGESDVLVMPDIEAGNAFYKAMTLFAQARTAGILWGTQCPVVVPSRGDNAEAKFNSILFALASL